MEDNKKYLDESTLTYLRNYIDAQDKVIYKAANEKTTELVSNIKLGSIPLPTVEGSYVLKVTVTDGVPSYQWVLVETSTDTPTE